MSVGEEDLAVENGVDNGRGWGKVIGALGERVDGRGLG